MDTFIFGALKRYWRLPDYDSWYGSVSMAAVLALLLLHVGLLALGLWRDGYGLPPVSYATVYAAQLPAIALGSMALTVFLAYELKRWFADKHWWKYIEYLQLPAMLAIFVHALTLGGELGGGWFVVVWWLGGILLVTSSAYSYWHDYEQKQVNRRGTHGK